MMSLPLLLNRRPTVRKPIAARAHVILAQMELIGGELFADELVKRQVLVKRFDHVVPIRIRKRIAPLFGKDVPLGVRVPRHVQPVPARRSP